jgi:hypothetical protein
LTEDTWNQRGAHPAHAVFDAASSEITHRSLKLAVGLGARRKWVL